MGMLVLGSLNALKDARNLARCDIEQTSVTFSIGMDGRIGSSIWLC